MTVELFLSAALAVVVVRIIVFNIGAVRERRLAKPRKGIPDKFVSVVIPARNEEENIETVIRSVAANTYPTDKYEIIAVDDRSKDNTGQILYKLTKEIPNLKIIKVLKPHSNKNLQGKAGALQSGIEEASGEIILFTDADCTVQKEWISTMASAYDAEDTSLAASYTIVKRKNFFHTLQTMEWVYMHTLASAGIGLNMPLGCFGNNLSVRAKDFWEIGGYKNIDFSVTEDLALLQTIFDSGKKTRYVCSKDSVVETLPIKTFPEYIRQHHRWAIGGLKLGMKAAFFIITSAALWLGILTSLFFGEMLWAGVFLLTRILGDFTLMKASLKALKLKELQKWLLPSSLFFMLVEIFVPFLLLKKQIKWKDQVLKNATAKEKEEEPAFNS